MGPVEPVYEVSPPSWILKGRFHSSSIFADGPNPDFKVLSTNNLLIRTKIFSKYNLAFDESMALTGGTDALLGKQVEGRGIVIHWSSNAIVKEYIPLKRCRVKWLLLRRFRSGNVHKKILKKSNTKYYIPKTIMFSLISFHIGIIKMIQSIGSGKHDLVKGVGYLSQSMGVFASFFGYTYYEYNSAHQRQIR